MISLILTIALVGALVWLITQLPMPPVFKNVIYVIAVFFLIIMVLQTLGVHTGIPTLSWKS